MKKLACVISVLALAACSFDGADLKTDGPEVSGEGIITVALKYESIGTKALTDYTTVLDEEKLVKKVRVYVFDKSTGVLNAYNEAASLSGGHTFKVTAGQKTIYAVVNGPDMDDVLNVSQLAQYVDDLSSTDITADGLTMAGMVDCNVSAGEEVEPLITVKRMVSRVVLQNVTCSVPPQYGKMTLNAVYLGNANTVQTFSASVSGKVNPDGYADASKTKPIGKNGVTGACPTYMYRSADVAITTGSVTNVKKHMYCQPSGSGNVTCMYLLVTIGGSQYYYRVPLQNGLTANTTTSVDVNITNLGSPLPPDGDMQKGEIVATVSIAGWDPGEEYEVEF